MSVAPAKWLDYWDNYFYLPGVGFESPFWLCLLTFTHFLTFIKVAWELSYWSKIIIRFLAQWVQLSSIGFRDENEILVRRWELFSQHTCLYSEEAIPVNIFQWAIVNELAITSVSTSLIDLISTIGNQIYGTQFVTTKWNHQGHHSSCSHWC